TMKRIGLELGGKAANVVFADADFRAAVEGAAFAGYIGQGQTCIAGARVLVERELLDRFVDAFRRLVEEIRVGDPLAWETQMGPQISAEARRRTETFVVGAVEEGAVVVAG